MSETQRDVASFMIRFTQDMWRNTAGDPELQFRGRINHVQGDEEITFTDFSEAVRFIQEHLAQLTLDALPGDSKMDQEKALRDSFKLWEEFTNSYSSMMFDAMERTIDQSETIKRQMDEAVKESMKTWQPQMKAEEDQIAAALASLSVQIEALAARIENLEATSKGE